jgi:Chlorophyll A-B binding protein
MTAKPTPPKSTPAKPAVTPNIEDPKFGFNGYAERLNGRAAMLGFILAIAIEATTQQGVMAWLGFIQP